MYTFFFPLSKVSFHYALHRRRLHPPSRQLVHSQHVRAGLLPRHEGRIDATRQRPRHATQKREPQTARQQLPNSGFAAAAPGQTESRSGAATGGDAGMESKDDGCLGETGLIIGPHSQKGTCLNTCGVPTQVSNVNKNLISRICVLGEKAYLLRLLKLPLRVY